MNKVIKRATATLVAATAVFSFAGCSGGKPSKDEVSKGLTNMFKDELGSIADESATAKFSSCVTDEVYDKLSASTLKKIAKEKKEAKITEKEEKILTDASTKCASELIG